MFVTTVVVGAVVVSKPFTLTRRPYMRDLIFYLAAVYWTFFVLWENRMSIWISLGEWVEQLNRGKGNNKSETFIYIFLFRVYYDVFCIRCSGHFG